MRGVLKCEVVVGDQGGPTAYWAGRAYIAARTESHAVGFACIPSGMLLVSLPGG